ncbi:StbB family protein [Advenella alkanexedens]|uniref:StbB family protein n=1 Tax=Advenella alkanexedens TaxID=1481665 RepID=UPI0026771A4A|nr:StbB family protein [Advenella alkanexedens]WKU20825.1 StbB family protein [Advenella alkanexedens]
MKIAILNYSGSVGKTVIASHLLAPRLNNGQIFAIESTNETAGDLGLDIDQLRGEQFGKLFRDLLVLDDAIIDVGASNIEDFLTHMSNYEDSHTEIDLFVLPVVSTGKAQRETIKTASALAGLGVEPKRIQVLFNRVEGAVEDDFISILAYAEETSQFIANPAVAVFENEVFELLAEQRTTIADVLADKTDYRQKLREADRKNKQLINQLTNMHSLQALAKPVNRQLDKAFMALIGDNNPVTVKAGQDNHD